MVKIFGHYIVNKDFLMCEIYYLTFMDNVHKLLSIDQGIQICVYIDPHFI